MYADTIKTATTTVWNRHIDWAKSLIDQEERADRLRWLDGALAIERDSHMTMLRDKGAEKATRAGRTAFAATALIAGGTFFAVTVAALPISILLSGFFATAIGVLTGDAAKVLTQRIVADKTKSEETAVQALYKGIEKAMETAASPANGLTSSSSMPRIEDRTAFRDTRQAAAPSVGDATVSPGTLKPRNT